MENLKDDSILSIVFHQNIFAGQVAAAIQKGVFFCMVSRVAKVKLVQPGRYLKVHLSLDTTGRLKKTRHWTVYFKSHGNVRVPLSDEKFWLPEIIWMPGLGLDGQTCQSCLVLDMACRITR